MTRAERIPAQVAPLLVAATLAALSVVAAFGGTLAPLPDWLEAFASEPFAGGVALLGVSLHGVWRGNRVAASAAAFCAVAFAALDVYERAAATLPLIAAAPTAGAAALAAGVLTGQLARDVRKRFSALVAGGGVCIALCLAVLAGAALGLSSGTLPPVGRALVAITAALAALDCLVRGPDRLQPRQALALLGPPVCLAGVVGSGVLFYAAWAEPSLDEAMRLRWLSLVLAGSLLLHAALLATIRGLSQTLALRALNGKRRRLLKRQRAVMRERAQALKRTRTQYDQLFLNVPAAVLLTDPSGKIIAANPAMVRLLGVESEAAIQAHNFAEFYADRAERRRLIAEWHSSGVDRREGEVALRRASGEEINVLWAGRLVKDETGQVQYQQGTFTDISALRREEMRRRKLETHLRLSQKLESVGRLAAGIAHEINTPLQYVGDNVYFLRSCFDAVREYVTAARAAIAAAVEEDSSAGLGDIRRLEGETEIEDLLVHAPRALARADEGVRSVSRIVAAMKELAHPDQGSKSSTEINALVDTALVISKHEYKTIATVEAALGAVPNVLAYKTELCQVLINLIVNAAHAIETAKAQDHRAGVIRVATEARDGFVTIRVADNGCGIPDSARDKIFDPFFTTKPVGKGTGQGLAISRATIVEKHGGRLTVDSAVGVGTTFTIELPLGEPTARGGDPVSI